MITTYWKKLTALALLLLSLGFAERAEAKAASSKTKALACQGEKQHKKEAAEARQAAESDAFYTFAVKTFGAPTSCKITWDKFEDQLFHTIVYEFPGATYTSAASPPETTVTSLTTKDGFPDEKAAEALLKAQVKSQDWKIDWSKPDENKDQKAGTVTTTYWSPDEGDNLGVDFVRRDKKLVGLATHMAL